MNIELTPQEWQIKIQELKEDIQFVDRNILGISSLIISEIEKLEILKSGIDLYKLDGIKLDRDNNKALVEDLSVFERQLMLFTNQRVEEIMLKSEFVHKLTYEHTRLQGVKKELQTKLNTLIFSKPSNRFSKSNQSSQQNQNHATSISNCATKKGF